MKLRKKTKFILFILLIILIGYFIYPKIMKKDKPSSEIEKLMQSKNIKTSDYSKTLEYVLLNNIYDEKYLKEYKDIEFKNEKNFEEILTTFLPKGYKGHEINYLFHLSDKNIEYLKDQEYQDISNYYKIKNFDASKIERYNKYSQNNKYTYDEIVTHVNMKLDLDPYTDTLETKDPNDLLVLVNKYNCLPDNYKPSDLVYEPGAYGDNVPMRKIIQEPFQNLKQAAKEEKNINFLPSTAFRNQNFQATLYNNYVARDGKKAADTYSARPGCSEHQTGLSIDLRNINLGTTGTRLTESDFNWLKENAYKYGFIIRFPKDKEYITGYIFENWHIRYVGKDVAKIIYEQNLTLEEYIDLYVAKY